MSLREHLCQYCRAYFDQSLTAGNTRQRQGVDGKRHLWTNTHGKTRLRPIEWSPHWPSMVEFMKSASDGCHLCSLFMLQVSPKERAIFKTCESRCPKKGLRIGVQESADRAISPYDLYLSHPLLENILRKDLVPQRLCLQMRPTQGRHTL